MSPIPVRSKRWMHSKRSRRLLLRTGRRRGLLLFRGAQKVKPGKPPSALKSLLAARIHHERNNLTRRQRRLPRPNRPARCSSACPRNILQRRRWRGRSCVVSSVPFGELLEVAQRLLHASTHHTHPAAQRFIGAAGFESHHQPHKGPLVSQAFEAYRAGIVRA